MIRFARSLQSLALLACGVVSAGLAAADTASAATVGRGPNGALRYYDDRGQDRGLEWCLKLTNWDNAGRLDCSYTSYEQCRASSYGWVHAGCEKNPFAFYVTQQPPASARRR